MQHRSARDEIDDRWDRLWDLRCQLDDQMQSKEASMADLKHTITLASKVVMQLKALLDAREEPSEKILEDVREEFEFEEVD